MNPYKIPKSIVNIANTYDANGNTLSDLNKGVVSYEWDVDNRLASILIKGQSHPTVFYTRSAGGQKLSETTYPILYHRNPSIVEPILPVAPGFASHDTEEINAAAIAGIVIDPNISSLVTERNYYGNYIYKNDTFDRVMTSTGYYDGEGLHSFVRDWQGNVRGVARRIGATATLEQTTFYYPYGLPMAESTSPELNRCKYSGKEYLTHAALNISDFDARILDHTIPRFLSTDALSKENTPHSSDIFCNADPINRVDIDGKWSVEIHVAKGRSVNGYGVAIVYNRKKEELFRFNIRAEGSKGHNRMKTGGDTPLGRYKIPSNAWIYPKKSDRRSYGKNPRLNMIGESGEIIESGRSLIRIHGGRQEHINPRTNLWEPDAEPALHKTNGCLRAYDEDMETFKATVDEAESSDNLEKPDYVNVTDDLDEYENENQ